MSIGKHARALTPIEPQSGRHESPVELDPFAVSLADKVALCLRAEEALKHPDVKVAQASVRAMSDRKLFLSSDGAEIDQEIVECGGDLRPRRRRPPSPGPLRRTGSGPGPRRPRRGRP